MLKKSRTKFLKVVDDAARINYNKQSHSFDGLEFVCEQIQAKEQLLWVTSLLSEWAIIELSFYSPTHSTKKDQGSGNIFFK